MTKVDSKKFKKFQIKAAIRCYDIEEKWNSRYKVSFPKLFSERQEHWSGYFSRNYN